jgi:CubicO group peptidase (beta-lactamase class C family)
MVIRPLADNAAAWPAGQLFSTAPEFARFCIAFMNDGQLEGRQVLSPFVIEQLSMPRIAIPNEDRFYGYGLSIRDAQGLRWLSHSGSRTGYGSLARMCPERNFAVIILCNKTGIGLAAVADLAAKIVLGIEPPEVKPPTPLPIGDAEMLHYVGSYANGFNTHTLRIVDDKLFFSRNRPVVKVGERNFVAQATSEAPRLEFSLVVDQRNEVTHLMSRGRAYKKQSPDAPQENNLERGTQLQKQTVP